MEVGYYAGNRERLYKNLCPGELLAIFSGEDVWKTGDECYPFFTERNFVYLTGLRCKSAVLLAIKDADNSVQERLYILPPDAHAERWTGTRVKPHEAEAISGVKDIRFTTAFDSDFKALAYSGNYGRIYLDLYRFTPSDADRASHKFAIPIRASTNISTRPTSITRWGSTARNATASRRSYPQGAITSAFIITATPARLRTAT